MITLSCIPIPRAIGTRRSWIKLHGSHLSRTDLWGLLPARFLALECKSPLYTHVAETLKSLSTIRAFGWQEAFVKTNIARLDTSQKPSYLLYRIQRWLGLVLRLLVAIMAVIVVALATNLTDTTNGSRLSVSLSQIVTFNSSLGFLLTFWTMLETSLGAIARLKGFQERTKSEDRPEETLCLRRIDRVMMP